MNWNRSRRNLGFTLIELLVVIAIIGILIGLLLPAVQAVRSASTRTQCMNNMRQIGLAVMNYEAAFRAFPPSRHDIDPVANSQEKNFVIPATVGNGKTADQSWMTQILPYMEQTNLADLYDFKKPWYDTVNIPVIQTQETLFTCPSAPGSDRKDPWHVYGAAAGDYGSINEVKPKVYTKLLGWAQAPVDGAEEIQGVLAKWNKNPVHKIIDGQSNTLMLGECAGQPTVYLKKGPMTLSDFANYKDDKVLNIGGLLVPEDGTGWADPDNGFSINGATPDGLDKYGPKMMNAINVSEVFSFHSGGAVFVSADGSTQFLNENIGVQPFVSRCTRAGREVVPLD